MSGNLNLWLVIFRDDAAMLDVRAELGTEHGNYIDDHSDKILLAGGLRHNLDTPFIGGSWLVKAAEISEVKKLVENDPYFNSTHRKYDINFWGVFKNNLQEGLIAA